MITTKRKFDSLTTANPLIDSQTSFMLLRTDPAMTGNVKITVDSNADIWLNSFDANTTLSDTKYKRFSIQANGSYASDLQTFFDDGATQPSIVYELFERDSYLSTKRNLYEQFDNFYCAGADQVNTNLYSEDFSFFAPLYLKKEVPDYFVILRMDNPFSYANRDKMDWTEIIQSSKIIKTFDLTSKSNIGQYIQGIVNDPLYTDSPLSINFDSQSMSYWNGIAYDKGILTSRGENLNNFFSTDRPIIEFDDYITQGFSRHSIISTNMLNMEFLFNDDDAANYSINRYWGIYISENELANFQTSVVGLKLDTTSPQTPKLDDVAVLDMGENTLPQYNPNGAIVYANAEKLTGEITLGQVEGFQQLFYLKDKLANFYTVSSIDTWATDVQASTFYESTYRLHLANQNIDYANFIGKYQLSMQSNCQIIYNTTSAQKILTFTENLDVGDFLEIEWKSGNSDFVYRVVVNNLNFINGLVPISFTSNTITLDQDYQSTQEWSLDWVSVYNGTSTVQYEIESISVNDLGQDVLQLASDVNLSGVLSVDLASNSYYWEVPQFDSNINVYYTYINNLGGLQDTLNNFVQAFQAFQFEQYYVTVYNQTLIFKVREGGTWGNNFYVRYPIDITCLTIPGTKNPSYVSILSPTQDGSYTYENVYEYQFDGGTDNIGSVIKVTKAVSAQVALYLDNYASSVEGYAPILGIFPYLEVPVSSVDVQDEIASYTDIDNYDLIILSYDLWYLNTYGQFNLYTKFKPSFGIASIFPIKDFDVDFYSERYGKTLAIENNSIFRNFSPGETLISGAQYYVNGSINLFNISTKFVNIASYTQYQPNTETLAYFVINGDYTEQSALIFDVVSFNTIQSNGTVVTIDADIDSVQLITGGTQTKINLTSDHLLYGTIFNLEVKISTYVDIITNQSPNSGNFIADPNSYTFFTDNLPSLPSQVSLDLLAFDEDLNAFKGFSGLSDFINLNDEVTLAQLFSLNDTSGNLKTITQRNLDRQTALVYKLLNSEYFKLQENYTKEYSLNSRVVPYILKWALQDGKDVRDNPYRLNVSRNFGLSNFTPLEIAQQSPAAFSHEWFYLDHTPANLRQIDLPDSFNYFYSNYDDFHALAITGNAKYYLTTGYPLEEAASIENADFDSKFTPVLTKISEKFSLFEYNQDIQKTYTFFKGIRFQIDELIANTSVVQTNSTKYDGYTFSIILKEVPFVLASNAPPIAYKMIEYTASSHVQFVIEYSHVDYRSIVDYVSLYSSVSKKIITGNALDYDDHRLSCALSLGRPSAILANSINYVKILPHTITVNDASVITFETNLYQEILQNKNGKYTTVVSGETLPFGNQNFASIGIRFPELASTTINVFDIELTHLNGVYDAQTVTFPSGNIYKSSPGADAYSARDVAFNQDEYWAQSYAIYYYGGKGVNENIINRFSFATVMDLINTNDSQIQYQAFDAEGNQTLGNFQVTVLEPHNVTLNNLVYPVVDLDKPETLQMINTIGYVMTSEANVQLLNRYGGDYEPIFRNVIEFALTENQASPSTYHRNTTVLNDSEFGIVENMFINKVCDTEILRIPQNVAYPSEYPLINEISIDKKDFYIFDSNWNSKFYQKYQDISTFQYFDGINELQEFKTFLGSKLMKTELSVYFQGLGSISAANDPTQDDCLITGNVTLEFLFQNRLINYFLNNGVLSSFMEYETIYPGIWGTSTAVKAATDYVQTNILNLYILDQLSIYTRPLAPGEAPYLTNLDESGLFQNGYSIDNTVKPVYVSQFDYKINKTILPGSPLNITAIITFRRV